MARNGVQAKTLAGAHHRPVERAFLFVGHRRLGLHAQRTARSRRARRFGWVTRAMLVACSGWLRPEMVPPGPRHLRPRSIGRRRAPPGAGECGRHAVKPASASVRHRRVEQPAPSPKGGEPDRRDIRAGATAARAGVRAVPGGSCARELLHPRLCSQPSCRKWFPRGSYRNPPRLNCPVQG